MSALGSISEFMVSLVNQLIKEREIATSTANQYIQTLYKLNGSKAFKNLAWTKKFDEVQARIDEYAESTRGNQYMVLTSALSLFKDKQTYKAAYNHWRTKMMELREANKDKPTGQMTDKQKENWMDWEEVKKKRSELYSEITSFISNKTITEGQYDKLICFVVLSLYTEIQPRRNADYLHMYVVRKMPKDAPVDRNYYDVSEGRFVFNVFKTAKSHGQEVEQVPPELADALSQLFKHHPGAKGKWTQFKLLVKYDASPLTVANGITRILNRCFDGKKIGASMLRHAFLTHKYGDMMKEMSEDTKAMGTSVEVAKSHYIKTA
jgi:predicted transcriptional regulator